MALRRAAKTFFLSSMCAGSAGDVHALEHDGDWSIVGELIRWIANTPAPARK